VLLTWDHASELLAVVSLLGLLVLVKLLALLPVDVYWDAGAKWHFVRQWSYTNSFRHSHWSHHMARMGVNVPAYFVQLLFGTHASVYYVLPIAMFALQTLFVYLLCRRLSGRGAATLGVLLMTFSTAMTRGATQLLPDGMAATAAIIAGYALVRFHDEEGKKRLRWLVGVGLACIWAYAIKEASVLFFPGVMVAVFLSRRSIKDAFVLGAVLGAYALLETAAFRLFTPYPHRLAVVDEEHGLYPPIRFIELFDRFTSLQPAWQMLFWMWLVSVIYDLGSRDKRRRLLLLLPVGFVLVLTFLVRRIDPIIRWESFKPRYMSPTQALFVVGIAMFWSDAFRRAWSHVENPKLLAASALLVRHAGVVTAALCTLLGSAMYWHERSALADHALVELRRDTSILNDAFRRNLPIIELASNPRALNTIYAIYLEPEYLAHSDLATDGRLPDIQEGVRFSRDGGKKFYVVRDRNAYGMDQLNELVNAGCAVIVSAHNSVSLSTATNLPASCRAPSREPAPKSRG
jgi:hypothetical protein